MTRKTGIIAASLFLFCILFSFRLMSPLALDDYGFLLRLHSLSDIITKSVEQYYTWDGRLTGYILTLSMLSLPHVAAAIVLPLLQLLFIYVMAMHALGIDWKERIAGRHLLGIACLLWLSIPDFGQVFFWRTGTPYIIIPTLYLLFLWPYRLLAQWGEYRFFSFLLLIPLAIFCGLADFHNTVAIAILTFTMAFAALRGNGTRRILPFIPPLLLLLCFIVIYTAPGNTLRIAAMYPEFFNYSRLAGVLEHLRNQGSIQFLYLWEYALMAISLLIMARHRTVAGAQANGEAVVVFFRRFLACRAPLSPLCMATAFFLLAQAVQMVFMFSPSPENRVYASSVIFMILAALLVFQEACRTLETAPAPPRVFRWYWAAATTICLVGVSSAAVMYAETKSYANALARQATEAAPGAHLEVLPSPYRAGPRLFYGRQCGIQKNSGDWVNEKFAEYYRLSSVKLVPQHFALLSQGNAEDGTFVGRVKDSSLSFVYTPSGKNADLPFYLAFPAVPETFFQKYSAVCLQRTTADSALFRYNLRANHDRVFPRWRALPQGVRGNATLTYPDMATNGYIIHYRGTPDTIVSIVPLRAMPQKQNMPHAPNIKGL